MEEKKKRGRPKKIKKEVTSLINELVKEIQEEPLTIEKVEEVESEVIREDNKEIEQLELLIAQIKNKPKEWDFAIGDEIPYFDPTCTYELTGYKPIDNEHGLDFNPDWFTEIRDKYIRTGHYCLYPRKTKAFNEFWDELYRRCINGMTVNGYTITGDHYFFLNFYLLDDLTSATKAGGGRLRSFPKFFVEQYKYYHYLELCKRLRKNSILMKARGVGFSEMDAALLANSYNSIRNSVNVVAALQEIYLTKTLAKVWNALAFLNDHTDGGFFKLRLVKDLDLLKRASVYKMIEGLKTESGWMALIQGIVADKPNKIRGDRTDLLFYEELGSWPNSTKAFILGDALVGVQGSKFGIKLGGGTGGDTGAALEGLRKMYEQPKVYDVLPYKHNYTSTNETVLTGMFIPAFNVVNKPGYIDNRGFTDPEKGKEFYMNERAKMVDDLQALLIYIAEYCFTAEEAFSLEGDNKFNKVNIVLLLTKIRALHECPPIKTGSFNLLHNEGSKSITGSVFIPSEYGKVKILEPPVWEETGGEKLNGLYIAGIDGIDIGAALTSETTRDPSDFCIVIKKRAYGLSNPKYVAVYKDRPYSERDAYKIAMGLMMYYNAKANIEASRLSMLTWAKDNKLYNWFMGRPISTYSDMSKRKISAVGTPATPAIINHQTDLIKDFTDDYCDELWFEDMLDELNRYTDANKRKFDYVAAMAMCELADEELSIKSVVPKAYEKVKPVKSHLGYYTDEYGYKRYGLIPESNLLEIQYTDESFYKNYGTIRSSDPRTYI